ncbi:Uncharacterized protein FWK35_00018290 [Aphis craccivora]|uniref:Uncharacterized protein n=1 Tax=Aphis craccivora TaxID=307492 RepID=A0A6G0Z2A0_APHCR|nr:Uncharacterized protein FWK35_00018290 [Aphis craccivora]
MEIKMLGFILIEIPMLDPIWILVPISYLLNIPLSMDSLHLTQDYIGLVPLSLRLKLIDIMFVYDCINYNIVCPELLSDIGFRIPYMFTHTFFLSRNCFKTKSIIIKKKIVVQS